MQNSLRMAVAGTGGSGQRHAQAIKELEGAELAAVCDIDPAKARELAEKHGIWRYGTDLAVMFTEGGMLLEKCAAAGVHCIADAEQFNTKGGEQECCSATTHGRCPPSISTRRSRTSRGLASTAWS